METLGEWLKRTREGLGLNQSELARRSARGSRQSLPCRQLALKEKRHVQIDISKHGDLEEALAGCFRRAVTQIYYYQDNYLSRIIPNPANTQFSTRLICSSLSTLAG